VEIFKLIIHNDLYTISYIKISVIKKKYKQWTIVLESEETSN